MSLRVPARRLPPNDSADISTCLIEATLPNTVDIQAGDLLEAVKDNPKLIISLTPSWYSQVRLQW
jgi:hypothetical protein